jgi:membrane protease YdiL (CAAX protease family)
LLLAAGTLVIMGGAGWVLAPLIRQETVLQFLSGHSAWYLQILIGLVFGFITAKAGWGIVELPFLKDTKSFFVQIIKPLKLSWREIVFVSLCAGIGEEMLFRGAIQPYLGIWTTAVLFVLLHGYLNPFNLSMTVYGVYMVVVIGVIGYLTEFVGIFSAILAHAVIDVYLLYQLAKSDMAIPKIHDDDESGD